MTALARDVRARTDLPLGINVLRNDGRSALAVAHEFHLGQRSVWELSRVKT